MNLWLQSINNLASPPPPVETKTCGRCKQTKPISAFYLMGGRVSHACKVCHKTHVYSTRRKP